MFNFLKSAFTQPSDASEPEALVEEFARENVHSYPFDLKKFKAGIKFLSADAPSQHSIVMAMLAWLDNHPFQPNSQRDRTSWQLGWKMRQILIQMLKRTLPLSEQDVSAMLGWSTGQISQPGYAYLSGVPQMIKLTGDYLKNNPMGGELQHALERLIQSIESQPMSVENYRWILRLRELAGDTQISFPLAAGDAWADQALSDLQNLDSKTQAAWGELLLGCLRTTGSAPSGKWLKGADKYLEIIGTANFFNSLLRWFPLVDKPREVLADRYDHRETLLPVNADILKGLVWLCSKTDDPEVARALAALAVSAYRKIPGSGPRASKVGNACFWTLGNMPGNQGTGQLSILKLRIKTNTAQRLISSALDTAAGRLGMTAEEIEEMSVPVYGLEQVGLRRDELEDVISEVRVNGSDVEQIWIRKDGRQLSSAPKAVKENYPEELRMFPGEERSRHPGFGLENHRPAR